VEQEVNCKPGIIKVYIDLIGEIGETVIMKRKEQYR